MKYPGHDHPGSGHSFGFMAAPVLSKVPQVTLAFWVIKILTTAMGEATSDFLVHWNPAFGVLLAFLGFIFAFVLQWRQERYIAWIYWLLVVMIAIVGTMAADVMHAVIGVPFVYSTLGFAIVLCGVFLLWHRCEGSLSIDHITTRRRELFYWLTVCATFALGTAAGDTTAATLKLGFFISGLLFLVLFLAPAIGWRFFGLNDIFAFWFSYIMTRPLGASFADWAGKPVQIGGLNFGDGAVSLVLTLLILVFVGIGAASRKSLDMDPIQNRT
ncbi:MAG: hypothetical protein LBV73_03165 [Paraburkholderia sp.]|nr:hypothetical protein [Paraburkholderia sp.]